jgi:hypothetical protein
MQENAPDLSLSNTVDLFYKLLAPISDYEPLIIAIKIMVLRWLETEDLVLNPMQITPPHQSVTTGT